MAKLERARWWTIRRAQNRKPSTYRCPLCNGFLHVLIVPEGDSSRRRHAHTHCVMAARKAGRLPTLSEWRRSSGQARQCPLSKLAAFMRRRPRADQ